MKERRSHSRDGLGLRAKRVKLEGDLINGINNQKREMSSLRFSMGMVPQS